jgi:hypothetical protein
MRPEVVLAFEFVEYIPDELKERTLYISLKYGTATHKCCCGCGREVVTPLSPAAWRLEFNGKSVSLYPSIGNWSLPCKSHYFITNNKVVWASQWSKGQIARGRVAEAMAIKRYYSEPQRPLVKDETHSVPPTTGKPKKGLWSKIKIWFS